MGVVEDGENTGGDRDGHDTGWVGDLVADAEADHRFEEVVDERPANTSDVDVGARRTDRNQRRYSVWCQPASSSRCSSYWLFKFLPYTYGSPG